MPVIRPQNRHPAPCEGLRGAEQPRDRTQKGSRVQNSRATGTAARLK